MHRSFVMQPLPGASAPGTMNILLPRCFRTWQGHMKHVSARSKATGPLCFVSQSRTTHASRDAVPAHVAGHMRCQAQLAR